MAKKTDKKDKKKVVAAKKKPVAKAVKKAAPKKVAKPAPKAAKKVAAPAKKAAAPLKGKPAAAPAKKAVAPAKGKAPVAATAAKAVPAKGAKPAAGKPIPPKVAEKAAKGKKAEAEAKASKAVEVVEEVEETEATEEEVEEVFLTDAEGRRFCRVKDCDQLSAVDNYCRFHYLLYWKKIQIRKKILSEGKLERYIEDLTARYPDKFLEMLRKDLRSEKEFLAAIQELEIDESAVDSEFEDESANYIEEVRGMGEATGARDEEDF